MSRHPPSDRRRQPERGVPVVLVNPRNTSGKRPRCACCSRVNRVSRGPFRCQRCGFEAPADYVGAPSIRAEGVRKLGSGAASNQPMAAQPAAAISGPLGRRS
ncbi:MAG: transposase [Nitrososphaerota archaeon]|nr:transposase [Nitrososphaerota archaeon]